MILKFLLNILHTMGDLEDKEMRECSPFTGMSLTEDDAT